MVGSDVAVAEDSWAAAGFVKQNYDYAPMKRTDIVAAQTIPAGWTEPCDTAVITVSE